MEKAPEYMAWCVTEANDSPVLVVGEALVDVIVSEGERREIPGGSAANVALGLSRRGLPVRLATSLARDDFGALIADALTHEGVTVEIASYNARRTSIAIARRNKTADVSYEFDTSWTLPSIDLAQPMSALHLGSFPAFFSDLDAILSLLDSARERVQTSWDPNVRPSLTPDRAGAKQRFLSLISSVDLLKLSDEDADYLLPSLSVDEVADIALDAGVCSVVVTLGSNGMLLATAAERMRVPSLRTNVVDTIGAGDTVMCSLIAELVSGRWQDSDGLAALGERAAAAAAITVSRAGANLPRAMEL